jgi:hypothetical protein
MVWHLAGAGRPVYAYAGLACTDPEYRPWGRQGEKRTGWEMAGSGTEMVSLEEPSSFLADNDTVNIKIIIIVMQTSEKGRIRRWVFRLFFLANLPPKRRRGKGDCASISEGFLAYVCMRM